MATKKAIKETAKQRIERQEKMRDEFFSKAIEYFDAEKEYRKKHLKILEAQQKMVDELTPMMTQLGKFYAQYIKDLPGEPGTPKN